MSRSSWLYLQQTIVGSEIWRGRHRLIGRILGGIKRRSHCILCSGKVKHLPHRVHAPATLRASLDQGSLDCCYLVGQAEIQKPDKFPIAIWAARHQIQASRLKGWRQISMTQGRSPGHREGLFEQ